MKGPDLSIIIVSFNTRELLKECLHSIYRGSRLASIEIYVVDNASRDGSSELVKREFPEVRLIENGVNTGFAKANNQALRECAGRYSLLLNSDTEIRNDALDAMVEFMDRNPDIGVLGPQLLNSDGSLQPSGNRARSAIGELWRSRPNWLCAWESKNERYLEKGRRYNEIVDVDDVSGACMLVRRSVFEEIGLLDENYFFCYEDLDFCRRARRACWRIIYFPKAKVLHHWGKSVQRADRELRLRYLQGKFYYFRKYYGRGWEGVARIVAGVGACCRMVPIVVAGIGARVQRG